MTGAGAQRDGLRATLCMANTYECLFVLFAGDEGELGHITGEPAETGHKQ